jgi:hypothetical protein
MLKELAGETKMDVVFSYNNMQVGKFDKEQEYIDTKKKEYDKKELVVATSGRKPG